MVNHNVSDRVSTKRVLTIPYMCITTTETHVTDNHVMGIYLKTLTCYTYTVTGCCLSCYGNIRSTYNYRRFKFYNTAYIEYYNTCATLLTSPSERTYSVIVKIAYGNHL